MRRLCESIPSHSIFLFMMASFMIGVCEKNAPYVSLAGCGVLLIGTVRWIANLMKLIRQDKYLKKNSIRHKKEAPCLEKKLGKKLVTVQRARGKVIIATVLQVIALVYAVVMFFVISGIHDGFSPWMPVFLVAAVILGLLPLRCWNDSMELYERGFSFCGDFYLYEQVGYPKFCRISGRGMNMMTMNLEQFSENISYLKRVPDQFTKAYMNKA